MSTTRFFSSRCIRQAALCTLVTVLALAPFVNCPAAEVGEKAPPLQVTNWVKGELVDMTRESTNIHVILFWETWCDSCMASLPELVELQKKLRSAGVKIVGVSPETPQALTTFLTNSDIGPKLNFTIAADSARKTFDAYITDYGQTS